MAETPGEEKPFFPRGAIAFFIAMTAFFGVVWAALYALMIHVHGH